MCKYINTYIKEIILFAGAIWKEYLAKKCSLLTFMYDVFIRESMIKVSIWFVRVIPSLLKIFDCFVWKTRLNINVKFLSFFIWIWRSRENGWGRWSTPYKEKNWEKKLHTNLIGSRLYHQLDRFESVKMNVGVRAMYSDNIWKNRFQDIGLMSWLIIPRQLVNIIFHWQGILHQRKHAHLARDHLLWAVFCA